MTDAPEITVAIPTCNGTRHLAAALRSVLAQQGVARELVVSDDRSEDETLDIVASVAGDRARVHVNSERLGLAGNWNQCLALMQTPYIAIFHQDDIMLPGHLAAHVAAFEEAEGVGLVASATSLIDDAGHEIAEGTIQRGGLGRTDRLFAPGELLPELAVGNPLRCSAVTLRGKTAVGAGRFDPTYRYALDWDLWLRVARESRVAWLAEPTVAVRWHPASETHRFKTGTTDLDEQVRLLDQLYAREGATWPNAPQLRRAADERLARAFLNRAYDLLHGGDPGLARRCLKRSVELSPSILATIAADPRLAAQMTALAMSPGTAGRWFNRQTQS